MLVINNPMVIFCDEQSYDEIAGLRQDKRDTTRIIKTEFNQFHCYQYISYFLEHSKMDPEVVIGHSVLLYMIWNEKSHFLKRAIELNAFGSEYYLWTDIGCFRRPNTEFLRWPNPARIAALDKERVLLLSVVPFTTEELRTSNREGMPSFQYLNRIGGTIFGGGRNALLEWHDKYYSMLEYFISIERFIGKDQSIMNGVYLLNRQLCDLVDWQPGCTDRWFYLQDYLR